MNTTDLTFATSNHTVAFLHSVIKELQGKGFETAHKVNTKSTKSTLIEAANDLLAKRDAAKAATKKHGKKVAAAPRKSAHADCDHETTKAARAKCRRSRAAEKVAGDQLEAASKGKKGRKLHAVAS